MNFKKKLILTILLFTLLTLFIYNNLKKTKTRRKIDDIQHQISSIQKCSPFNVNYKQKYHTIDNETYPKKLLLHQNNSINFKCLNQNKKIKVILFWTTYYGHLNHNYGLGVSTPLIKEKCPITNCEITADKSRLNESDYVLVHVNELKEKLSELPKQRPYFQRWIFLNQESPYYHRDYYEFDNFFNLTATYTRDSNFPGEYERMTGLRWNPNDQIDTASINNDYLSNKTKFAAAVISNCQASNGRLNYINKLKKYIQVDLFGKCGQNECSRHDCKQMIAKEYKFYLSFENSNCRDYITEKFFHIIGLNYNIIPIVYGGGDDYQYYIPKSGFINIKDYKSIKDLSSYLIYLDSNKTAYNSYFEWKKYAKFNQPVISNYW